VSPERPIFPFTAIVGQDRMKRALVLNAINPQIGGVLIRGEKGTAKSTAVRAFARLLPELTAIEGCRYGCDPDGSMLCADCTARRATQESLGTRVKQVPVVELPVGATEDRLVGTLDIEQAIKEGERVFEPGLLATANRGILYIDEVNLLSDHLVDVLLDAAAMGQNYVEREGISVSHPAQFILVGTMNPEEGDLRPQLLDRFALAVQVEGLREPGDRAEVVRRRIAFEADSKAFAARWHTMEEEKRDCIVAARALLPCVQLGDSELDLITRICAAFEVDGLRGDIVMYKTAQSLAAYAGRTRVTVDDVREAAELALVHRRRRQPFDQPDMEQQQLDDVIRQHAENDQDPDDGEDPGDGGAGEQVFEPSAPFPVRPLAPETQVSRPAPTGRRSTAIGREKGKGRYIRARMPAAWQGVDLALDATLRAAAPYQRRRRRQRPDGPRLLIAPPDLREKVRETKVGQLVLFAVDASGSMAARQRMIAVKGAVLSMLLDAYQKRDRVGLLAFRGDSARLLLAPTNSVELGERQLRSLPTGGRTPLARALQLCDETLSRYVASNRSWIPWLILISDGRPNVPLTTGDPVEDAFRMARQIRERGIQSLVIDTENGRVRLGLNSRIAQTLGADCLRLEDLAAGSLEQVVRHRLGSPTQERWT
jgi:magnesium chelatase subunit D